MNSPQVLTTSGGQTALGTADMSKILLVGLIVAVLVLVPAATPAGSIAAEMEGALRRAPTKPVEKTHI